MQRWPPKFDVPSQRRSNSLTLTAKEPLEGRVVYMHLGAIPGAIAHTNRTETERRQLYPPSPFNSAQNRNRLALFLGEDLLAAFDALFLGPTVLL